MLLVSCELFLYLLLLVFQHLDLHLVAMVLSLDLLNVFYHLVSVTNEAVDALELSHRLLLEPFNFSGQCRDCIFRDILLIYGFLLFIGQVLYVGVKLVIISGLLIYRLGLASIFANQFCDLRGLALCLLPQIITYLSDVVELLIQHLVVISFLRILHLVILLDQFECL